MWNDSEELRGGDEAIWRGNRERSLASIAAFVGGEIFMFEQPPKLVRNTNLFTVCRPTKRHKTEHVDILRVEREMDR